MFAGTRGALREVHEAKRQAADLDAEKVSISSVMGRGSPARRT